MSVIVMNLNLNLQLLLPLQSFSSLFSFPAHNFTVLFYSHCSHSTVLHCSCFLLKNAQKNPSVNSPLSTKRQTDTVSS